MNRPIRKPLVIVPHLIARSVLEEASLHLEVQLPRHWIRQLTQRAHVTLDCNADFRRKIDRGNTGRDLLWSFMRHWLYDKIAREFPTLLPLLPTEYAVGRPLPTPKPPKNPRLPLPDPNALATCKTDAKRDAKYLRKRPTDEKQMKFCI